MKPCSHLSTQRSRRKQDGGVTIAGTTNVQEICASPRWSAPGGSHEAQKEAETGDEIDVAQRWKVILLRKLRSASFVF